MFDFMGVFLFHLQSEVSAWNMHFCFIRKLLSLCLHKVVFSCFTNVIMSCYLSIAWSNVVSISIKICWIGTLIVLIES